VTATRIGAAPTAPSSAPAAGVIFEDQFSTDASLGNWHGTATKRKITGGIAEFYSANHTTFKLARTVPVEGMVVEWRGAADRNGFHGVFGPYGFNLGGWENRGSGYSGPGHAFKRLDRNAVYQRNRFHDYRLERAGDRWAAYIDGRPIFDVTITGRVEPGGFHFISHHALLRVDRLRI